MHCPKGQGLGTAEVTGRGLEKLIRGQEERQWAADLHQPDQQFKAQNRAARCAGQDSAVRTVLANQGQGAPCL